KERTTAAAITEGTWGFEHTKACFRDDIIPFVKALKEQFTSFDQCLIDEVTERNTLFSPESALTFAELFEINDLKAQAQAKDTVILKLKEKLHSLSGDVNKRNEKREVEEIETLNIELDHKSAEVSNLNASRQEKVLVIIALKEQLNKLKGKAVNTKAVSLNPIDPELLKVKVAPLAPKLRKNKTAHTDYIRHTQGEAATLREIVENERLLNPLNTSLDYGSNIDSNTPVLSSTGVILVYSASGSMSQDNTKKNRIRRTQTKDKKNKLEDHLRIVSSSLNKKSVVATSKVVQIVLWYLDSDCSKHMTGDRSQLVNFVQKFLGTVKFGNDNMTKIMGYGDYHIGNVTISRVYYVEGLRHSLFSNSNLPALQDDLILSVIEQLKTQVVNYTKINQDNKHVNELLTTELERYRNQERVLTEQNNNDKASTSYEPSVKIETLKHTLSEHLKEKESLEQKITLLKNDFQKEESRNIDRELALENQIKELNNIVFKRNQFAQTVHMLTKPQVFYNHSTRQALGFQNPCYLKKAQQLKPKLYDGCVIEKSDAIVVLDSEETLLLAEERRSKMIAKQNDPTMIEKKFITKPIDYAIKNQLLTDFETRFVPETELSAEQAFWSQYSVQTDEPTLSASTTIVEVLKELPKVSMVNSCLKKLKFHLASFDMVVKKRTIATTEGTWGFKHTKACFRDDIIPFVKALKE
nr:integrase, catalytic region, zinc finger, CCHC-type, peptidase aspartic, catalytic [Tanacetum cinerariifolium]